MNSHDLPGVLTGEDQDRIERKLAELPDTADGPVTISVFLPVAKQVMMILAQDGDIVSWCLMPAREQGHAPALTELLKQVFRHELEIVNREVAALADAVIARVSSPRAA